jgi:Flp pilus assembly protein TadD
MGAPAAVDDSGTLDLLALWHGELLAGRGADIGPELATWLDDQSALLWERLLSLILPAAAVGGVEAEGVLRRLAQLAPLDERVVRALLTNLSRHRSSGLVDAEYQSFVRRLREDTGGPPELDTRLLAASVGARPRTMNGPQASDFPEQSVKLPRVLVLPPLASETGKRSAERIAASLVDDVIFSLCRMKTFAVIAPHTARAVSADRGSAASIRDVDYVMFTRLLPGDGGADYRFGFSLAHGSTGEILVGDSLRFSLDTLPLRHGELAALISRIVAGEIERSEFGRYRAGHAPTAYVYYLLGQQRLRMVDLPDLRAARRAFQHALELAPTFAPAMSMIARTLSIEWFVLNRTDNDLLAHARSLASQAVDVDPTDPGGYRELGNAALYSHDLDASLHYLTEARERAPHHADVLLDNADSLLHNSRYAEARKVIDQAIQLNPLPPDEYLWVQATIQFFQKDYRGAKQTALQMKNPGPLGRLISVCAHLTGEYEQARYWRDFMLERHPDFRVKDWGRLVPLRNAADKRFFEDAMRKAGFP